MKRVLLIILLAISGCSSINPLSLLNPSKPSIEANVNMGKNVEQEKSNVKLETGTKNVKQDAETISNDTKYKADSIKQITQNIPPYIIYIVIALSGLAIDGKGFILSFKSDLAGICKFPFNFILRFFNKQEL